MTINPEPSICHCCHNLPLTMNVTQTARFMGLDRKTVSEMCRKGELGYIPRSTNRPGLKRKIGRLIPRFEILEWIRKSTVHNPEELKRALDRRRKS